MAPGKGAHMVLNQGVLDFIEASLEELSEFYTDGGHDEAPEVIQEQLLAIEGSEWIEEKDNFGRKVYRTMPYKKGELRVTVVLTKQNELRLDIREWYDPNQA